jgi:2-C-methyl-D-erythritol 4-phosphate cytidylyltransferase
MGFDKLRAQLSGASVLSHSLRAVCGDPRVSMLVVVASEENHAEWVETASGAAPQILRKVVLGGELRHQSVANGLAAVGDGFDLIAVHDAARPLLDPVDLTRVLDEAQRSGAATLCAPVTDTLKKADAEGRVSGSVPREGLWGMQTPQVFRSDLIRLAYQRVCETNAAVTDEVSAVEQLSHPVALVPAQNWNFKITFPQDLRLAELILRDRGVAVK